MTSLLIGVLSATLGANPAEGVTNAVSATGAVSVAVSATNTAAEFERLQSDDDAAQAEVDQWVRENNELKTRGSGATEAEMNRRIRERFEPVRQAYETFLLRHPDHARAHLAYGSFLNDRQDEAGAQAQWERVLELDPGNADAYNNLAGRYSESGPVEKVFEYFAKAIELNPSAAPYYHNFADSLYVLKKRAAEYYHVDEQQIFARTLQLYSNAARLDPQNFTFASDFAQAYYVVKPLPTDDALKAWTNALQIANSEPDREAVYVHCARIKMLAGRLAEARAQLTAVTNEQHSAARANLIRVIEQRERPAPGTNTVSRAEEKKP